MRKMFHFSRNFKLIVALAFVASASSSAMADGKKLNWAGPISSLHGAPSVGVDQMKLVDVHGPVTVKTADGNTIPGTEGLLIPSGATILTAANASAAVFMGGVNSARFLPNTQATIAQSTSGSLRKTDINLRKGSVFSRVGHRIGESQDYKVHTALGVAAARGTKFDITLINFGGTTYMVDFSDDGTVSFTDGSGNQVSVTPTGTPGQVSVATIPTGMPLATAQSILLNILTVLAPFNSTGDEPITSLSDAATAISTNLGVSGGTTNSVKNSDGTTTTTTIVTLSNGTVVETDITTDDAGNQTKVVTSVTTTDPISGQKTKSTTTTDSSGTYTGTGGPGSGTDNTGLNQQNPNSDSTIIGGPLDETPLTKGEIIRNASK